MIDIPLANPVKFRPLTGQTEVNFDNTFEDDYTGENRNIKPFSQYVLADDWQLQVVTDYNAFDESGNCSIDIVENFEGTVNGFGPPTVVELGGLYYYTFTIRPQNTGCFKLWVIESNVYVFESEWLHNPIGGIESMRLTTPNIFKVEWFNLENNFGLEYVNSNLVNIAYVEGKMIWGQPAGDVTVFDNQGEEIKLKEIVQRVFNLSVECPAYFAEMLTIAMAHDKFYINDVEYISTKKAQVSQIGNSNLYSFNAELIQVTVLGINTHDTGFDCDASKLLNMILNISEQAVTGSFTETIPVGYLLHVMTSVINSGSATVEIGTTLGGDDILTSTALATGSIELNYPAESTQTIYVTVTGTINFDVNLQLLKNR